MPLEPLIETKNLTLAYNGSPALRAIDFAIMPGEIVTIVGPNGSGKSTLLRGLIGALPPATGQIRCASHLRIGYVPQRLVMDMTLPLTVERFLSLPQRRSRAERMDALENIGLANKHQMQLHALSGGQLQRVLLARALLNKPNLLILDEPTQNLDQPGVAAFYQWIAEIRADLGCAVLMVSHDLHVVMAASDRVLCVNGHICCQGTPDVVASAPEYRALFGTGTGGALALYRHHHSHEH